MSTAELCNMCSDGHVQCGVMSHEQCGVMSHVQCGVTSYEQSRGMSYVKCGVMSYPCAVRCVKVRAGDVEMINCVVTCD